MTDGAEDRLFAEYRETRDPARLGRVYDLVSRELLSVALHLSGRPHEAEDLLQATFLVAIERADDFDPKRRLVPWLMGILARKAREQRSRAGRRPDPERLDCAEPVSPAELAEAREFGDRIDELLGRVPTPFRPVLVLRLRHGLAAAEIADALGRPPGTVRSQLQRGLELMRRGLPTGLAGAALFASVPPTRGLEAVREAVLGHAASVAPPLVAAGTAAGVLMTKKTMLAAAGCLAAVSLVVVQSSVDVEPDVAPLAATVMPAELVTPEDLADEAPRAEIVESARALAATVAAEPPTQAAPEPHVVTETGTGGLLVRARLEGTREPAEGELVLVEHYGRPSGFSSERTALTDADGIARFDDLPPGFCTVMLLRGAQDQVRISSGAESEVTLRVKQGMEVWGRVVDEYDLPVANAAIRLSREWRWDQGYTLAETDEDGFYELSAVGPHHFLSARSCGRRASLTQQVRGAPGDRVRMDLVLGGSARRVRGRVVAFDGLPIAGTEVQIGDDRWTTNERRADGAALPATPQPVRTVTDDAGRFEVCDAPLGEVLFRARAGGFAPVEARVRVEHGNEEDVVLVLEAETLVRGVVRDAEGDPVPYAAISCVDERSPFTVRRTSSDTRGHFEVRGLPVGEVLLDVVQAQHGYAEGVVDVRAGETTTWDPVLVPNAGILGHVVDEHGNALDGWRIAVFEEDDRTVWHHTETRAPGGRFAVFGTDDVEHFVTVHAPKTVGRFPRAVVSGVRPGDAPLEITVPDAALSTGTIEGVVLDAGGQPVEGASLTVWHEEKRLWRSFPVEAKSGRIHVAEILPGPCYLEVKSTEHPWLDVGTRLVEAGVTLDLGTLVLESPHRVRGTLSGLDAYDSVDLFLFDDTGEAAVIERNGQAFVSGPVGPGDYVLQVQGDFVVSQRIQLQVGERGDTERDVHLVRAGMRRVAIETTRGEPDLPWIWFAVLDANGRTVWSRSVERRDGRLVARVSAPPGTYRMRGETRNGWKLDAELVIRGYDGADPELVVTLTR